MAPDERTVIVRDAAELVRPTTRRGFLRALGLVGTIVLMPSVFAACSDDTDLTGTTTNSATLNLGTDIGIFNYAYALEQLEAAFYTQAVASFASGLSADEREMLTDIRNDEVTHREFLRTALGTVRPVDRGALQVAAEDPAAELNPADIAQLSDIEQQVASLNDALHDNDAAAELLGGFTNGIRRAEASGWRTDPAGGTALVRSLQSRIDALTGAVHLVQPAVGTYSLSSSDSPVVVTVSNQLPRPVTVLVSVAPAPGVIGFQAQVLAPQTIGAHSIDTIRIPTHVGRVGRFQVIASLRTPDGRQLGQTVPLNLRATSIGTVTKIITVLAITVLALALLRRLIQLIRNRRQPASRTLVSA